MLESRSNQPLSQELPKAKYKKELAQEMGLSMRTFQRRLENSGIEIPRGLIPPEDQKSIFKKLGWREMA